MSHRPAVVKAAPATAPRSLSREVHDRRKVGGAEGERKKKGVRAQRAQNDRREGGEVHDQEEE
jgi:hypothetical protein